MKKAVNRQNADKAIYFHFLARIVNSAMPTNGIAIAALVPDNSNPHIENAALKMNRIFKYLFFVNIEDINRITKDKPILQPKLAASVKKEKNLIPE
ncbi:hypothetical protein [Phocaeicola paurosaccharolyticus]|uniref:hypothetical protein n=1 Tax=Phocaeicola paurosaccharolyticus TaxID=732242 RepID=UPI000468310D|nr:hypothetical protein [Phocaeicola paurosaccharolyticus]